VGRLDVLEVGGLVAEDEGFIGDGWKRWTWGEGAQTCRAPDAAFYAPVQARRQAGSPRSAARMVWRA